jgi:hypothetical protein
MKKHYEPHTTKVELPIIESNKNNRMRKAITKIRCVREVYNRDVETPKLMNTLSISGVSVFPPYFKELNGKMQNRYIKLSEEGRKLVSECETMVKNKPVLSLGVFNYDMLEELSNVYNKTRVLYNKNLEFIEKVNTFIKVFNITCKEEGNSINTEVNRIKSITDSMKIFNDNLLVQLNEYKLTMPLAIDIFVEGYFEDILKNDLGGKYSIGGSYVDGILEGQSVIQLHILENLKNHVNHKFWCKVIPYGKFPNDKYTKYLVDNKYPINSVEFRDNFYESYPQGNERIAYGIYGLTIKHLESFLKSYLLWSWVNQESSTKPSL